MLLYVFNCQLSMHILKELTVHLFGKLDAISTSILSLKIKYSVFPLTDFFATFPDDKVGVSSVLKLIINKHREYL